MSPTIDELIIGLNSEIPVERQRCRHRLVDEGAAAVQSLTELLDSDSGHLRWEAAKALAAIADPSSIPALIRALEDTEGSVRWDTAVGLAQIGQPSVEPVLEAVIERSHGGIILEGAHHVINELAHTDWGQFLRPVYESLGRSEPAVSAPVAAAKALEVWRSRD